MRFARPVGTATLALLVAACASAPRRGATPATATANGPAAATLPGLPPPPPAEVADAVPRLEPRSAHGN
ncbi:MAG: septal ring lytic transglycosylase RlpA, partial [Gammaproteobacteria bacterium]|nr:septal ring lytic transglycosylase RlpA [Gammaproteobacteria bacterium]